MYSYIFGPVASRRFGLSLGIDLSPAKKSCNFDCLYCELEPAKTVDRVENPPSVEAVITEVKEALKAHPDIDVITITANGEPTLYPDLERLVDALNEIKGDKKLLILSNASRIADTEVQKVLRKIDIVKLSLDCATPACFKKLDRPIESVDVETIIHGMETFRKIYDKALILEILVVAGINDKPEEMKALKNALDRIRPDRVDLGTVDRPPAYAVKGVTTEELKALAGYLGNHSVSIIHKETASQKIDFTEEEILATIRRRPQSASDVAYLFSDAARKRLEQLLHEGKVKEENIAGVLFYTLPENRQKRKN